MSSCERPDILCHHTINRVRRFFFLLKKGKDRGDSLIFSEHFGVVYEMHLLSESRRIGNSYTSLPIVYIANWKDPRSPSFSSNREYIISQVTAELKVTSTRVISQVSKRSSGCTSPEDFWCRGARDLKPRVYFSISIIWQEGQKNHSH